MFCDSFVLLWGALHCFSDFAGAAAQFSRTFFIRDVHTGVSVFFWQLACYVC